MKKIFLCSPQKPLTASQENAYEQHFEMSWEKKSMWYTQMKYTVRSNFPRTRDRYYNRKTSASSKIITNVHVSHTRSIL